MNLKIADEWFDRLTENNKFVANKKDNEKLKKRVKKLFREAYASGFSDGLYSAQDNIDSLLNNLQPNYDGLLKAGKDRKW